MTELDIRLLVGRNIVRARQQFLGLSQNKFSKHLGVPRPQLSTWERGVSEPNHRNLLRIAEAVGQPLGWFYNEHDDEGDEAA
jgi:transcriptional regulator with XRE-family HTH domain